MAIFGMVSNIAQYRTYTIQISDIKGETTAGEYLSFRMITCFIAFIFAAFYSAFTCRLTALPTIILYCVYKIIALLIDVLHGIDQLSHRMDYIGKSLAMQGIGCLVAFTAMFVFTHSLEISIASMIAVTLLIGLIYDYPRSSSLQPIKIGIDSAKAVNMLISLAPIVLAGVAFSAAPSIPRQYLSFKMGDSALGAYAAIATPVSLVQVGACYIYNPLLSYLSEAFEHRNSKRFVRLILKTCLGIVVIGLAAGFFLSLLGEQLLSLVYGNSIIQYLYLLQPLILCASLTGLTWFLNDLSVALRCFSVSFFASIAALLATAVLMVPAVGQFGLNGVTVVNIVSCVTSGIMMIVGLTHCFRRNFSKA